MKNPNSEQTESDCEVCGWIRLADNYAFHNQGGFDVKQHHELHDGIRTLLDTAVREAEVRVLEELQKSIGYEWMDEQVLMSNIDQMIAERNN